MHSSAFPERCANSHTLNLAVIPSLHALGLSSPAYLSTAMASVIASGRLHVFEKCYQDAGPNMEIRMQTCKIPILYHEGVCSKL